MCLFYTTLIMTGNFDITQHVRLHHVKRHVARTLNWSSVLVYGIHSMNRSWEVDMEITAEEPLISQGNRYTDPKSPSKTGPPRTNPSKNMRFSNKCIIRNNSPPVGMFNGACVWRVQSAKCKGAMVHVCGVCMVQGARCKVQSAWCMVQGAKVQRCMVQGAKCMVHVWLCG